MAHTGHAFTFSRVPSLAGGIPDRLDTSSNALFAALQATAARRIDLSDGC
ncbi:hypothetical protein ACNKHO_22880 [Shigella flexneri]